MPLTESAAVEAFAYMKDRRAAERDRLERIRKYLRDDPTDYGPFSGSSETLANAPVEVRQFSKIARVNVLRFVVSSRVQSMFVDGYRARRAAEDAPAWEAWQANGMDARQIGVHRAGLSYGAGYVKVLPGEPMPVLRGASPLHLTAVYGDDDVWPVMALEARRSGRWRLYDDEAVYEIAETNGTPRQVGPPMLHEAEWAGRPVCPVVRFRDTDDLDEPVVGIVEPFIPLQEQINVTTFALHVAQHYGAFRQRYILGWLAESEEQKLKASAAKLWTFEDDNLTVGEFDQTDLSGYIDSREASLRHLATVSQTPAHELIGQLVNLSAEALAAAEASKRRAITENQEVMGEAWEQTLGLAAFMQGQEVDPQAYVRWRDTESRSLGMVVDALGKAVIMLGIPPQELWERVADAMGVSQQELESWKAAAADGDAFANLEGLLALQAAPADGAV